MADRAAGKPREPDVIPAADARRLFLHRHLLLQDAAAGPASPADVLRVVESLGFVQVDTITVVERAHHLILASRLSGYRPERLTHLLESDRQLFEHWTHDASLIPLRFFPQWRPRFRRYRRSEWHRRQIGAEADRVVRHVLGRVRREGPLRSSDFEHDGPANPNAWWGWKPQKVALEYLWRCGVLFVVGRRSFQKVYDLTERAAPVHAAMPPPTAAAHLDWACRTALQRLGPATPREIAAFWAAVKADDVARWLRRAGAAGEVRPYSVESADGSRPRLCYALEDARRAIADLPDPGRRMRLLCPFDPAVRDRARVRRLFDFDFRFEGFVPKALRVHGPYVMPILQGDRLIGRVDPRFDRRRGVLEIRSVWWESGVRLTATLRRGFETAVNDLAAFVGAATVSVPPTM